MNTGTLVLFVGPPGSGKGTLKAFVRTQFPEAVFPMSWTTRPQRPSEADGDTYHFVDEDTFRHAAEAGEFLEWVSLDGSHLYGTPKSQYIPPLEAGKLVIREVEPQGVHSLQKLLSEYAIKTIFIDPGTWDDFARRIIARAPISAEELENRRLRYEREMPFKQEADFVIENPDGGLEAARRSIMEVLKSLVQR